MLNKRLKEELRNIKNKDTRIKFCLGTLSLMAMCIALLIISTFTQIKFSGVDTGINTYLKFEYIPQIPIVLFIAALLGESFGLLTILIYIILGLTPNYPIFGMGGGLSYIFQYLKQNILNIKNGMSKPESVKKMAQAKMKYTNVICLNKITQEKVKNFGNTKEAVEWLKTLGYEKPNMSSIIGCISGKNKTSYGFKWTASKIKES